MISIRNWAFVAGITCATAFWVTACGGGDDATSEAVGETATATQFESERERALANLEPENLGDFEGSKEGEIRYSGKTETGDPFVAQLGGDIDVPEGFFDEIPAYPDAVPFSMMAAGGGVSLVTVDSKDDESTIYDFYKAQLAASDWEFENDINVAGGRLIRVAKGGRHLALHIQGVDGGGTRVGYTLTFEE